MKGLNKLTQVSFLLFFTLVGQPTVAAEGAKHAKNDTSPARNIQRGRDHGLPDYNTARIVLGLSAHASFAEVSDSEEVQERLAQAYGSVDNMDVWAAGLAEDPRRGSMFGELLHEIVLRQFRLLRDGDRYWYERHLSDEELEAVSKTRLADGIRRKTMIGAEIPDNVFVVAQGGHQIGDQTRPKNQNNGQHRGKSGKR